MLSNHNVQIVTLHMRPESFSTDIEHMKRRVLNYGPHQSPEENDNKRDICIVKVQAREMVSGDDQAEGKSGSHAHARGDIVSKGTTSPGRGG